MSYNLLRAQKDGQIESGNKVAPWSQRKLAAAALIRKANPDILTVQEASDWAGAAKGPRMVDDLRSTLGSSTWALARTEVPPSEAFYFRTGRYILYKSSVFSAVGEGGHWDARQRSLGGVPDPPAPRAPVRRSWSLSIHLEYGTYSRAKDVLRQQQTRVLLGKVRTYLANRPMPVLYLGDFNSHEKSSNVFDGPAPCCARRT